jgi:hypothetical protein
MDSDTRAKCEALWCEWCRDQPLEPLPDMGANIGDEDAGLRAYHRHVARFIEGRPLREAQKLLRAIGDFFRDNGTLLDIHFPPIDETLAVCRETERLGRPLTDAERQATVAAAWQHAKVHYGRSERSRPLGP